MKQLTITRYLHIGFPLLIASSLWLLVQSSWFHSFPAELSSAITLDFLLTIPIVYFLLIRKTSVNKLSVLSVAVLGLLAAGFILPENQQSLLQYIRPIAIPLIELTVFAVIGIKVRQVVLAARSHPDHSLDFFDLTQQAVKAVMPGRLSGLMITEIGSIYYGLFHWKKRELGENEFSYHQKSGILYTLFAIVFIVMMELFIAHILLVRWNPTVAWGLTALSAYSGLQLFALGKSIKRRPIKLDFVSGMLKLRYGFFREADIPLDDIARIEMTTRLDEDDKTMGRFSALGFIDSHNLMLHLNSPATLSGIYGMTKSYESVAIFVDKKAEFVRKIEEYQATKSSLSN